MTATSRILFAWSLLRSVWGLGACAICFTKSAGALIVYGSSAIMTAVDIYSPD